MPTTIQCSVAGGALLFFAVVARADVTITQTTSLELAAVHAHGATTEFYTADKKRHDSETHCEGMMSMFCGNLQSGEIVRLDRGVTWKLEPKKKMYREDAFATPEQIAAMKAEMNARLEKMKSCPAQKAQQQPVDKSGCQMSPPKYEVRKTGEHATIAGFATERTIGTMTASCANPDTGEVCDTVIAIDTWLTSDNLPGSSERRAFQLAYAKKLGMDDMMQTMFSGQMATYMAAYQTQFSELAEKAKQFKGQPMKSTFRVLSGGAKCKSVQADTPQQSAASDPGPGNPMAGMQDAGKAVGQLVGGLFRKKPQADAAPPASAPDASSAPPVPGTPPGNDNAFPQLVQLVAFGTETTAIKTDPLPPQTFEVPADWTKEVPREAKQSKDDFQCPRS